MNAHTTKIPPQALELEEVVLGAILLGTGAMQRAMAILQDAECFYKEGHKVLFRAMQDLQVDGKPIDIMTVLKQLRSKGKLEEVGGAHGLTVLTSKVNSAQNIEYHCRIIQEHYVRRKITEISGELAAQGYDETKDAFALLAEAQSKLGKLTDVLSARQGQTAQALHAAAIEQLRYAMQNPGLTGVPSGMPCLDKVTGGWQKSDLIIVAARPGMGKSALVISLARSAAVVFKKPGAIFTLEMSSLQFMNRMIAYETEGSGSEYTNSQLSKGRIGSEEELQRLAQISIQAATHRIIIDDTPALPLSQLQAKCAKLKDTMGLEWVMVDYLQLMKGIDTRNREQEVASISGGLKKMAKELNIPVIALAQLSRKVEERADKRPMLSDLRESGSIEQDADLVAFLYRDEYYHPEGSEKYDYEKRDTVDMIIAKHRGGALADLTLGCKIAHSKFYDLEAVQAFGNNSQTNSVFQTIKPDF